LIDRCDCIVDRKASFPLKAVGIVFCAAGVKIMLLLGNCRFHGLQIAGNFRFQRSPFFGGGIAHGFHIVTRRLDSSVYFFDRGGGGGTRLLPARLSRASFCAAETASSACFACADKSASCSESLAIMMTPDNGYCPPGDSHCDHTRAATPLNW